MFTLPVLFDSAWARASGTYTSADESLADTVTIPTTVNLVLAIVTTDPTFRLADLA